MNLNILKHFIRKDPFKTVMNFPSILQIIERDFFGRQFYLDINANYLQYTIDWIKHAQDIGKDDGISKEYSLYVGWFPSYPETTGYIIPTFLDYYRLTNEEEYLNRAIKMANWLVSLQMESGAFKGHRIEDPLKPVVFDTGQILLGFGRIYRETQHHKYLDVAISAANWLMEIQDADGAWRRFEYNGIPHAYNTRVDWALLEIYNLTLDERYLNTCYNNINWVINNREANGWFKNNAFESIDEPFLHTIAYTIEGLIECSSLTQNESWLNAAIMPADIILNEFETKGNLSGRYNSNWSGLGNYRCLTGEAQMALCWLRLFQLTDDNRYMEGALKMNENLKRLVDINSTNMGIKGGIKGSHPIWGGYSSFAYPNWAAKFFCDSLILETKLKRQLAN